MKNGDKPINPCIEEYTANREQYYGLTKREYFAGLAMQGMCSKYTTDSMMGKVGICKDAVSIADELLKQLDEE